MQSSKTGFRLLTDTELQQLNSRKDVVKISLDFGSLLDNSTNETTVQKLHDDLASIASAYAKTGLAPLLEALTRAYGEMAKREPTKRVVLPKQFTISRCGECGCSESTLCYAAMLGCMPC